MMTDYRTKSFWLATAGDYTANAPLKGERRVDVVILGGGFTGINTAYQLKRADPLLDVAVLESNVVGFGASGRNAAFAMTVFGLSLSVTSMLYGKERARDAFQYAERAVDYLGALVDEHKLKCDYERVGFLRMATTPGYLERIQAELEIAHALGVTGVEWLDQTQAREQVNSPRYLGAWWEPRMALVNPVKLVREMKRVAENFGARIFEQTPATRVEKNAQGRFVVTTPHGKIVASKIVFATNAYSHLLPFVRRKQVPAFTHIVLTEPLREKHFAEIGWRKRQGLEDARNLIHYYRLTADNRLLMGGGPVKLSFGANMNHDLSAPAFHHLESFIHYTFPALRDVKIEYRWGGPFSVTMDLAPAIGTIGDASAVYSVGCIGHGVALTHLNAQVLRDLILERKTDLTDLWFVNRRVIPWLPEPLRLGASAAIRTYLQGEDWWYEKNESKQ